jgi:amidohydrolase
MMDIKKRVQEHESRIVNARRDLHRIPETGYTEKKTSGYVADFLNQAGLEVQTGMAEFGVVGNMALAGPGKTLMIRADMDALPIQEETGLPFASTHEGAMHACGHDGHMAMVLGAAAVLNEMKDQLNGHIKFVFQPAEEGGGGAARMIEAGILEDPRVDYAVGCHLWPAISEGTIGVKEGPIMAAMDRFDLKIKGRGGHGAMPHLCIDALEVGTQVVNALQRMVSRQLNPLSPAVVTVGSFHAGTAFNIIPGEAELSGTTRTFDREIWNVWPDRMEKIIRGVCESMGADYEFSYSQGYPPTVNDASMADLLRQCAVEVVGGKKVIEPEPSMGGEDMAFYLEKTLGCYFFLGVGREGGAPIHNPKFDFNEDVLLSGVETYCRIALKLLGR